MQIGNCPRSAATLRSSPIDVSQYELRRCSVRPSHLSYSWRHLIESKTCKSRTKSQTNLAITSSILTGINPTKPTTPPKHKSYKPLPFPRNNTGSLSSNKQPHTHSLRPHGKKPFLDPHNPNATPWHAMWPIQPGGNGDPTSHCNTSCVLYIRQPIGRFQRAPRRHSNRRLSCSWDSQCRGSALYEFLFL
ncbi:hypothetical protein BU24DRAFT_274962 [Aaosphaeria arxii CBS 175.79]|uniref:Uncharacterized protein n=1 Tax=Aaosphaeria arxii CBS 175.79 TaxID=1450172 RepID=A0A6A5XHK8_9PLEO|nr:uncharacterized protein BU24DRAFT_274962 [Aaosphaeria arxii CBS 175.79]KAF2012336.1 hypothetical protein BU24DRAFT_274962 [Aaosphaeria arxii CBS 175.79]